MLNCEKWKNTLKKIERENEQIAIDLKGVPCSCHVINCENCFFCDNSSALQKCNSTNLYDWLCEEYKEPEINWDKDIDWERVPVDTPVLVRDEEDKEWKGSFFVVYFPNSRYNKYIMFELGKKQDTASYVVSWKYCKLANPEDVEKYRKR